jgi:hypothetical protein
MQKLKALLLKGPNRWPNKNRTYLIISKPYDEKNAKRVYVSTQNDVINSVRSKIVKRSTSERGAPIIWVSCANVSAQQELL